MVNLVAILHGSAADFERVHVELPQRLARACRAAGVRPLVHVSALGRRPRRAVELPAQQGRRARPCCMASGLDVTLLRPSVIFGAEDRFLNLFASCRRWRR